MRRPPATSCLHVTPRGPGGTRGGAPSAPTPVGCPCALRCSGLFGMRASARPRLPPARHITRRARVARAAAAPCGAPLRRGTSPPACCLAYRARGPPAACGGRRPPTRPAAPPRCAVAAAAYPGAVCSRCGGGPCFAGPALRGWAGRRLAAGRRCPRVAAARAGGTPRAALFPARLPPGGRAAAAGRASAPSDGFAACRAARARGFPLRRGLPHPATCCQGGGVTLDSSGALWYHNGAGSAMQTPPTGTIVPGSQGPSMVGGHFFCSFLLDDGAPEFSPYPPALSPAGGKGAPGLARCPCGPSSDPRCGGDKKRNGISAVPVNKTSIYFVDPLT